MTKKNLKAIEIIELAAWMKDNENSIAPVTFEKMGELATANLTFVVSPGAARKYHKELGLTKIRKSAKDDRNQNRTLARMLVKVIQEIGMDVHPASASALYAIAQVTNDPEFQLSFSGQ